MHRRAGAQQVIRTGIGGICATVVDVVLMIGMVEALRMNVAVAAFLATALGAICGFMIAKFWAFEDRAPLAASQVAAYGVVAGGTATLVAISIHVLVILGAAYLMAKLIASVGVFAVWSYPAQARWVFAKGE